MSPAATHDSPLLRAIAAAAAPLHERLGDGYEPAPAADVAEARLTRWRERVAAGDERRFARRLEWDGLDPARVRLALGDVRLRDDAPLPGWTAVLAEALEVLRAEPSPDDPAADPAAPLPFEPLLIPFVRVARRRLRAAAGRRVGHLHPRARAELERALLRQLCGEAAPTLYVEFSAFRAVAQSGLGGFGGEGVFAAFVEHARQGGMERVFARLPVLARLAATRVERWVETTAELLVRLGADRRRIRRAFAGPAPLGRVMGIETALSDPHRGGRTVSVLRFGDGLRVVYKPRPMGIDLAFDGLLAWIEARGGPALRRLAVVDADTHGWVEHAAPSPCASLAEVEAFHERAGMLLAIVYALGGSDFHSENLVACGAHPVLVDLEVMMGAPAASPLAEERGTAYGRALWGSVLRTHLLPDWRIDPDAPATREGGLLHSSTGPAKRQGWRDVNGDWMAPAEVEFTPRPGGNLPILDGEAHSADGHVERVSAGFRRMYALLAEHREALLAPGGPLEAFAPLEVRAVLRNTRLYAKLARRMLHADFLRSGADRSIEIEALCTPFLRAEEAGDPGPLWPVFRAERRDIEGFDIPIFSFRADCLEVRDSRSEPLGPLRESAGYAATVARIEAMGDEDLAMQERILRISFIVPPERRLLEKDERLTPGELRIEARAVADRLLGLAEETADGALAWLGAVPGNSAEGDRFRHASHTLDHGRAGIALFLASAARVLDADDAAEAALRTLRPTLAALSSARGARALADQVGIGGAMGMGGVIYALARIAGLLERPELLAAAARAAETVTPRRIAKGALDVFGGSAGAALGLLTLHDATGDETVLRRALACGRHLVARQAPEGGWITLNGRATSGFAHGAAGIAHALGALHRAGGDAALLRSAEDALRFERTLFLPTHGLWREHHGMPEDAADTIWCSWCHGAPGIALARAGLLEVEGARDELEAGIATILAQRNHASDHLCCGTMGRVEALLVAADVLDLPELRGEALARASELVARARRNRGFSVGMPEAFSPGFLQGQAGIGYALLRLLDPTSLPCALTWS